MVPIQRIAVIGSNSFSGSDFIASLLEEKTFEVLGISRSPEKSDLFLPYLKKDLHHYRFCQMDLNHNLTDIFGLLDSFEPDAVVNFACQSEVAPSWVTPEDWFQTNCVAFSKLLNHLKDQSYLKRYLHIGTPEVYGNAESLIQENAPCCPSTPYAISRHAQDHLLRTFVHRYQFPAVTVRAANVYGPHQQLWKIIPRSFFYLKQGRTIQLEGGGISRRSFIHIRDVSRAELLALKFGDVGDIFHLSTEETINIKDLVARICKLKGKSLEDCTVLAEDRPGKDHAYTLDSSFAREKLHWNCEISLDTGLRQVDRWVTENFERLMKEPAQYLHLK